MFGMIGDIVGSAITGIFNKHSVDSTNAANRDLWREQAAYNTPKNQMLRYQEAGLNPNLVYTQGNPGNLGTAPAMQAAQYDFRGLGKSFVLDAQRKNMVEQNKNLQEQNSLIRTQEAVAKESARKQKLENAYFEKYGQWPAQESGFVRGAKSLLNFFPQAFFRAIDVADDVFSHDTLLKSRGDRGK